MADVRRTLGDIRRAQQLGPGLARFTEAHSRLEEAARDRLADVLEKILPVLTAILEWAAGMVGSMEETKITFGKVADIASAFVNLDMEGVLKAWDNMEEWLEEIARNTRPKPEDDAAAVLSMLFGGDVEDVAARFSPERVRPVARRPAVPAGVGPIVPGAGVP